jgi:hypothetical protein
MERLSVYCTPDGKAPSVENRMAIELPEVKLPDTLEKRVARLEELVRDLIRWKNDDAR